jgi:2-phospho-L-lactate transferase/gluconeogenesis factor (CofD/UPF0052 family)
MLNVVILNGGRGAATVIKALLSRQGIHVTSIVNAYDDGKSTGEIRRYFSMLGPSDIRKVQELMLPQDDPDHESNKRLFDSRFSPDVDRNDAIARLSAFSNSVAGQLEGIQFQSHLVRKSLQYLIKEFVNGLEPAEHVIGEPFNFADASIMNCVYAGAFLAFGRDLEKSALYIDKLFKLRGVVLPSSNEDKKLLAIRENGRMLYSEAEIVELRSNVRIECIYLLDRYVNMERFEKLSTDEKKLYLERNHCPVRLSSRAESALTQADIIIYSSGTQHSSLYPTYMTSGVGRTIANNKTAYKIFLTNIGADYETPNYKASDYIKGAHRYLNNPEARAIPMQELFDINFVNKSRLKSDKSYVKYDEAAYRDIPVPTYIDTFESSAAHGKHDGDKVVETILELYEWFASPKRGNRREKSANGGAVQQAFADIRL